MESAGKRKNTSFPRKKKETMSPYAKRMLGTSTPTTTSAFGADRFSTPTSTPDIFMGDRGATIFSPLNEPQTPDEGKKKRKRVKRNRGQRQDVTTSSEDTQSSIIGEKRTRDTAGLSPEPMEIRMTPTGLKRDQSVTFDRDVQLSPSPLDTRRLQTKKNTRSKGAKDGNEPIPTPAMNFAKSMGWLDNDTFDSALFFKNFKKAYHTWYSASEQRPHDDEAQQKFRILDYIDDALAEKDGGELTLRELLAELAKIDDIEGPLEMENKRHGNARAGLGDPKTVGRQNVLRGKEDDSGEVRAMARVNLQETAVLPLNAANLAALDAQNQEESKPVSKSARKRARKEEKSAKEQVEYDKKFAIEYTKVKKRFDDSLALDEAKKAEKAVMDGKMENDS